MTYLTQLALGAWLLLMTGICVTLVSAVIAAGIVVVVRFIRRRPLI